MNKLFIIPAIAVGYISSFLINPNYKSFSTNLELVPDFKVSYECKTYEKLEGLDMKREGGIVTVNYGGLGRRRGFRSFNCLD